MHNSHLFSSLLRPQLICFTLFLDKFKTHNTLVMADFGLIELLKTVSHRQLSQKFLQILGILTKLPRETLCTIFRDLVAEEFVLITC